MMNNTMNNSFATINPVQIMTFNRRLDEINDLYYNLARIGGEVLAVNTAQYSGLQWE